VLACLLAYNTLLKSLVALTTPAEQGFCFTERGIIIITSEIPITSTLASMQSCIGEQTLGVPHKMIIVLGIPHKINIVLGIPHTMIVVFGGGEEAAEQL